MYSLPESCEKTFYNLFTWPQLRSKRPLEPLLPKLKIPVHFLFGDEDWMEQSGAKNLYQS